MRHRSFVLLIALVLGVLPLAAEERFGAKVEVYEENYRNRYRIEAATYADGVMRVSISGMDGKLVFESVYPVQKEDGNYCDWTYYGDPVMTRSTRIGPEVAPTLGTMAFAGKDIIRMIGRGLTPDDAAPKGEGRLKVKADDNWGCDIDGEGGPVECSGRGNCCDTHDECYVYLSCDFLSWSGLSSAACQGCNVALAACITLGIGSTGQKSACCDLGNCGQERCPTIDDWDNPNCTVNPLAPFVGTYHPEPFEGFQWDGGLFGGGTGGMWMQSYIPPGTVSAQGWCIYSGHGWMPIIFVPCN